MPTEAAHRAGFALIRATAVPGASRLLRAWLGHAIRCSGSGRAAWDMPGPLGLAAGFEKDTLGPDALGALGLAFVGVGTVTAQQHTCGLCSPPSGALDTASAGRVRLLVKIVPDLADEDIDAIADLAVELGVNGIIATNTTISRDHLATGPAEVAALGSFGLCGAPLKQRALEVLRRLSARTGDRLVVVASSGIETADDA